MDTPTLDAAVHRLLAHAVHDTSVLAAILFGSRARGDATPGSDCDICLVVTGLGRSRRDVSEKRLQYMALGDLDVVIFDQLPLAIRHRVLKEGRVLFSRDDDALYEIAIRTARRFEGFRHIHREYLEEVARG